MPPLFPSRFEEVVFWLAFIVGLTVPLIYFSRRTRKNAASTKAKPGKDVSTLTNFALLSAAVIAILRGYARSGPLPHWLFYPALTLFLLGLAVTAWAYSTLGRFFSLDVQIQNECAASGARTGNAADRLQRGEVEKAADHLPTRWRTLGKRKSSQASL